MRLEPLTRLADVVAACSDDGLVVWAAQGLAAPVTAWAMGDAVAVASPHLSRRDRLAVFGRPDHASRLVRAVLVEVGGSYRPLGEESLVLAVVGAVPELELVDRFFWMETASASGRLPRQPARWLTEADDEDIGSLLDAAFPRSYARPGVAGVRRWAGVRTPEDELAAIAADAWSAPTAGFVAGVATHPALRSQGYASAACTLVIDDLVRRCGRAALMVDGDNTAAAGLYRRLGLRTTLMAAARISPAPGNREGDG